MNERLRDYYQRIQQHFKGGLPKQVQPPEYQWIFLPGNFFLLIILIKYSGNFFHDNPMEPTTPTGTQGSYSQYGSLAHSSYTFFSGLPPWRGRGWDDDLSSSVSSSSSPVSSDFAGFSVGRARSRFWWCLRKSCCWGFSPCVFRIFCVFSSISIRTDNTREVSKIVYSGNTCVGELSPFHGTHNFFKIVTYDKPEGIFSFLAMPGDSCIPYPGYNHDKQVIIHQQ